MRILIHFLSLHFLSHHTNYHFISHISNAISINNFFPRLSVPKTNLNFEIAPPILHCKSDLRRTLRKSLSAPPVTAPKAEAAPRRPSTAFEPSNLALRSGSDRHQRYAPSISRRSRVAFAQHRDGRRGRRSRAPPSPIGPARSHSPPTPAGTGAYRRRRHGRPRRRRPLGLS